MSEGHARLGPSNHRWPHCPGSVREEAAYPDISGEAAIDGTGSHLLLEMCLTNNVRAEVYDQQIIGANHPDQPNGWLVGLDRITRVQMALDYLTTRVTQLKADHPGCAVTVESESRSNPGEMAGRTDWWGTCDITITVVNQQGQCVLIEVADYKDGRGWVDAKNNTQLESYLAGKASRFIGSGPQKVRPFMPQKILKPCRMTIIQPKTSPVIRFEEISGDELLKRYLALEDAAFKTDKPDAPLVPDNKGGKGHCQWCKHKPNCAAHGERDLQKVIAMGTDVIASTGVSLFELANQALGNVDEMSTTRLTELVDAEPGFMSIFDKAREEIKRRIESGDDVDGWDMVPGNGSNVWNDTEEKIAKALKGRRLKQDEIYPSKLASPAQIMKSPNLNDEQKARLQKELIAYKVGQPKLTRVQHKKKKEPDVEVMFADVPKQIEVPSFLDTPQPVSFF